MQRQSFGQTRMSADGAIRKSLVKRSKYSKNGCSECKRRKVKCDEAKPACWQCSHLGKRCVYLMNTAKIRFKEINVLSFKDKPKVLKKGELYIKEQELVDKDGVDISPRCINVNSVSYDTPLLATDLFESLGDLMQCETPSANEVLGETSMFKKYDKWEVVASKLYMVSTEEVEYLKVFYHKPSYWLFPLATSPDTNICNHVLFEQIMRTNLLENTSSSYLQSAMVTIAAKYLFNTSRNREYDVVRERYLQKVFEQLHQEFASLANGSLVSLKIENLILCVLILTLDNSKFWEEPWRLRLSGARDLFLKYQRCENRDSMNSNSMRQVILLLSSSWFAAIEFASLFNFGTLHNNGDIDMMFSLDLQCKNELNLLNLGLLTEKGFNIFLGYSTESLNLLKEIKKFLNNPKSDPFNDRFILISSLFMGCRKFEVISNEFSKIKGTPMLENSTLQQNAIVRYNNQLYSVFDTIHQTNFEALFMVFLMEGANFDSTSPLVQNSADRIWKFIEWIFQGSKLSNKEAAYIMERINSGSLKNYDDFKELNLNLVSLCLIEPLRKDFRCMMIQTGVVLCASTLAIYPLSELNLVRCKCIAYFQYLIDTLGIESGRVSIQYIFNAWTQSSNKPLSNFHDYVAFSHTQL
ncbi:Zn(II)2Cys6 transcription factor domain-containing protein Ecym_2345 [Eremothecium cymbalariae DBVPG|uniref:Zn(2)-C6 fungal-type domain-containing protein n=1 Tax=Eremothecium cymbalariae (strain CBS 270.75 / DBVPG 7215 / KCTC 17166 / NRRL Y-17582) TaxID=931890 RepID=G8JQ78_ERECY|nr:Hypothetical protein Ecym_2345 [Eremothecium cymbalariae DBVPG\